MNIWPFSTIRKLREQVNILRQIYDESARQCQAQQSSYSDLWDKSRAQAKTITRLTAELEQARRNDYRDPNTGKFTRRPANG